MKNDCNKQNESTKKGKNLEASCEIGVNKEKLPNKKSCTSNCSR